MGKLKEEMDLCQSPDCSQFRSPFVMRAPALKLGCKERASFSHKALWVSSPDYSLQAESGQSWGVRVWSSLGQRMAPVEWCFQRHKEMSKQASQMGSAFQLVPREVVCLYLFIEIK